MGKPDGQGSTFDEGASTDPYATAIPATDGGGSTRPDGEASPDPTESCPVDDPERMPSLGERPFRDYQLIRVLGRGGMGVIYEARQISLNRVVALKLITSAEYASDEQLRRFAIEAEAVAALDHPGIVPIYEVGEDQGRRFYTMKLISGGSLQDRAASRSLDPRGAAKMMATVARAVDHAHRRGILHRDLKPANILVDAEGVPHVTDFGLAKRVEVDDGMTHSGAILGTPAFMAPEQASGKAGAVTTSADVYGLGATLYALLAGRPPFRCDSVLETLDQVRERVPESPSRFNDRTPRDLEVICLKCLEKEPARRYASAEALADDLDRWLRGEPIAARPVSTATRLALWARRKPALAGLSAGLALALIAGCAGIAWKWIEAERESRNAERINAFLIDQFLAAPSPEMKGRDASFLDVVDAAAPKLKEAFADRPEVEASLQNALGKTYLGLGEFPKAEAHFRRALELYRRLAGDRSHNTLVTWSNLALALRERDHLDEAEAILERIIPDFRRGDGEGHPDTIGALQIQAAILAYRGKFAEAESILRRIARTIRAQGGPDDPKALLVMNDLGVILQSSQQLSEAEDVFREILDARRRIGPEDHPATLLAAGNLAAVLYFRGKLVEAAELLDKTYEAMTRLHHGSHPDTLRVGNSLGLALRALGKPAQAATIFRRNLDACRSAGLDQHSITLMIARNLALTLNDLDEVEEPVRLLRRNLEIRRKISKPDDPEIVAESGLLGAFLRARGRLDEAEPLLRECQETTRRTRGDDHPATLEALTNWACLLLDRKRLDEAEPLFREILTRTRRVRGPDDHETLKALDNLGMFYLLGNRAEEAEPLLRSSLEASRRVLPADHPFTIDTTRNLIKMLMEQGRRADAVPLLREKIESDRRVPQTSKAAIADDLLELGASLDALERYEEARPPLVEALAIRLAASPKDPGVHNAQAELGLCLVGLKDPKEAEPLLREAAETRRKILPPNHWRTGNVLSLLGEAVMMQGRLVEAEPLLVEGHEMLASGGAPTVRIRPALDRLIQLYGISNRPELVAEYRVKKLDLTFPSIPFSR